MAEENKDKEQEVQTEAKKKAPEQPETKTEETKSENKKSEKIEAKKSVSKQADDKIDPDKIKPGMTVRVHQKIRDVNAKGEEKERIQIFEGMVLAKRGKRLEEARILVRKISANHIGVEKLFPLASPTLAKIEIVRQAKIRRAKLYFLRDYKKKLKDKNKV